MNKLKALVLLLPVACCLLARPASPAPSLAEGSFAEVLPFFKGDRVLAISQRCREIRRSRQLLRAEGLDDRNLAILEERYCGRTHHRHRTPSSTCSHLAIMARLAGISQGNSALARMVAGEERLLCSRYADIRRSGVWRYANGQVVRLGSVWHYPNGQQVRTGRDWRYPNGEYASFGSAWKYPNGVNAKFGGLWYKPNGDRVDRDMLISWGCTYVPSLDCDRLLGFMRSGSTDLNDAALVALAWQAYLNSR